MTNSYHNKIRIQRGAAMLVITVALLIATTMIILFAANQSSTLQKITSNQYRNATGFQAAEAGLEYAINYLQKNSATILANPVSGFIAPFSNASTTNVTLPNNSKYSFVYTNPIANNYNVIQITSTGSSDDNTSTRVVSQTVAFGSLLSTSPNKPITSKGAVSLGGNATVSNPEGPNAITSAAGVAFSGSSTTVTTLGTGNAGSTQQNNSSLQSMTDNDFFVSYFGNTSAVIKSKVGHYYNNTSNTNYSSTLSGMTGTSIWIDQSSGSTATINGTTTIGSAAQPVMMVVNGNLSLSGNVVIYGFVYIIGTTGINTLTGNTQIIGGMVTSNTLNMTGSISITYNSTVLNTLRNQSSMSYYAKVPGSWKDF